MLHTCKYVHVITFHNTVVLLYGLQLIAYKVQHTNTCTLIYEIKYEICEQLVDLTNELDFYHHFDKLV